MRSLAEYVMRGRTEAIIASVLATATALFAWVGAAIVALVVLRRGPSQGLRVWAWALIPAIALTAFGNISALIGLVGVMLAATVLWSSVSWSWSLVVVSFWSLFAGLMLLGFGEGILAENRQEIDAYNAMVQEWLSEVAESNGVESVPVMVTPSLTGVAGMIVLRSELAVILCLMLGRWWQALLYNPGGFRREFHSLRLSPAIAVGLVVVSLAILSRGGDYESWALLFLLPLVFASFGLAHGMASKWGLGNMWLGLFYVLWLTLIPVRIIVILLAVVDSWKDFRGVQTRAD